MDGARRDVALIFLLLAFGYGYFHPDSSWNGNSRFGLVFAVVEEGRLEIDSFHERKGTATGDKALVRGHYYSDKAIGAALVGSAVYLPFRGACRLLRRAPDVESTKHLLTFFAIGIPSALAGSLIYVLGRSLGAGRFRAFTVTASVALGTIIFPFSTVFFGHALAASLLFSAFFLIFRRKRAPASRRSGESAAIGLLLGLALITDYAVAAIVLALAVYFIGACRTDLAGTRARTIGLASLAGALPVALALAYNALCFGGPFTTGYAFHDFGSYRLSMSHGMLGVGWPDARVLFYLTLHPAQGIFWQSPVLLPALAGALFLFRAKPFRAEALLVTFIALTTLLLNSGYFLWWGGWSFGPRFLVPMLPFLCLPLLFVPRRFFALVVVLALVSIGQMLIVAGSAVVIDDEPMDVLDRTGGFEYSSIYDGCLPLLREGKFAPNLGRRLPGGSGWGGLAPLVLAVLGSGIYFAAGEKERGVSRRPPRKRRGPNG